MGSGMQRPNTPAARPRRFVDRPPDLPGWVEEVLEAIALSTLAKFILLCHLHDNPDRRFEPPQLPIWSAARDGVMRETLDDLAARGVLSRHAGRREVSYAYDPGAEKRAGLEPFFEFLDDAWCRARVLRWIAGRRPCGR